MKPLEPVLAVDLFPAERDALLSLLSHLTEDEWSRPTVCAGWSVKDVASHLLGDDISRLSRKRDTFSGAIFAPKRDIDFETQLLDYINLINESWVQATRRISPRVLCDLLRFAGDETQRYFESLNLFEIDEPVSWAGPDPAPVWLDVAREYTERWMHHQHIRDAVDKPGLKERHFFAPVLDTFVRALPHTYRDIHAPDGTHVKLVIPGDAGGEWSLIRQTARWALFTDVATDPDSVVVIDEETAWRLFTKGISRDEASGKVKSVGDRSLGLKVLDTVSIIA